MFYSVALVSLWLLVNIQSTNCLTISDATIGPAYSPQYIYSLFSSDDTPTFVEAQNYCFTEFGTSLATVYDEIDQEEWELLRSDSGDSRYGCWIGLIKDATNTDSFSWVEDNSIQNDFFPWAQYNSQAEPNGGLSQLCTMAYGTNYPTSISSIDNTGNWRDIDCSLYNALNFPPRCVLCNRETSEPSELPTNQPTEEPLLPLPRP